MWQSLFGWTARRRPPRLPPGIRIYVVGDVHGRADLLGSVLARIDMDLATNPRARSIELFLGDYVDRGPESRQVIDQLTQRSQSREAVFLKGNHEEFM